MSEDLVDGLVQSTFLVMGVLTRVSAKYDLSLTQLRVLAILSDRRLRLTALADYLGLEKSTMSGLVSRAEQRGLLARERSDDDARAVDVFLTPSGRALVEQGRRDISQAVSTLTKGLSPTERSRLQKLLWRVLATREK